MKWKNSTLLQCLDKEWVYSDKYGFCKCNLKNVFINVTKNRKIDINSIFIKKDDHYERFNVLHTIKEYPILFNNDIAYMSDSVHDGWGGRTLTSLRDGQVIKINKINFELIFSVEYWAGSTSTSSTTIIASISKIEDLKKYDLPVSVDEDLDLKYYITHYPFIFDIKIGNKYYLASKGTVVVDKVFKYPSKDDKVCVVKDSENKSYSIDTNLCDVNGNKLYEMPFTKTDNEIDHFNDSINEAALAPFIVHSKENNLFNIYWQLIDDASGYIVELYKYVPSLIGKKKLYHLKDCSVDRNTRYLAIENLVGTDFIFVVKAENRNGDIIAKSRGIKSACPEWFGKEN